MAIAGPKNVSSHAFSVMRCPPEGAIPVIDRIKASLTSLAPAELRE